MLVIGDWLFVLDQVMCLMSAVKTKDPRIRHQIICTTPDYTLLSDTLRGIKESWPSMTNFIPIKWNTSRVAVNNCEVDIFVFDIFMIFEQFYLGLFMEFPSEILDFVYWIVLFS